jgi:hypothetical protein
LGVSTPPSTFDYGTFHEIIIETYSIDDPDVTIGERQVFLETKGVYVSEMGGMGLFLLVIIIILGVAFYIQRRKIIIEKYCIKPDKPWEIPEEKRYLEKLAKTDNVKHNEVFQMMENEYESALLWYKYFYKRIIKPKSAETKKIKKGNMKVEKERKDKISLFKKSKKSKDKDKPLFKEKPKKNDELKDATKKPDIIKEEVVRIDGKKDAVESKRAQVFARIKKEQERQRRRIKK